LRRPATNAKGGFNWCAQGAGESAVFLLISREISGMAVNLSAEQIGLALRLRARRLTLKEVGRQVGCHLQEVHRLTREEQRRRPGPYGW
jgi:hypothetical protein